MDRGSEDFSRGRLKRERGQIQLADQAKTWPTPNASDVKGISQPEGRRPECDDDLASRVAHWPTVSSRDFRSGEASPGTMKRNARPLNEAAAHWPTPQAHDVHPGDPARVGRYGTEHGGRNLTDEASLWPTPKTPTGGANTGREERGSGGPDLQESAEFWQTPSVADVLGGHMSRSGNRKEELLLPGQAKAWASPSDLSPQAQATQGGRISSPPPLGSRQPSRRLNPEFAGWLMGWPTGWSLPCAGALTAFGSSATESSGSPPPGPSVSSGGR